MTDTSAQPAGPPGRLSASQTAYPDGRPMTLDEVAAMIDAKLDEPEDREVRLPANQAEAIATCLNELGALYTGERLGHLASYLADRMWTRLGI